MNRGAGADRIQKLTALLIGLVLAGLTAAAAWTGRRQLARMLADQEEATLQGAALAFRQGLERTQRQGLGEIKLLAEDTRVRATVVTTRFDEATVRDVLDDLRAATQAAVLAVLDASGKVLAVSGLPALRGSDLSSAHTVKAAFDKPSSDVWTFGQQVLAVALAPVRAGSEVRALLLIGTEVGRPAVVAVEQAHGVQGALVVTDRVLVRGTADPSWDAAFRQAGAELDGLRLLPLGAAGLRALVGRTGDAPTSARVVFFAPRSAPGAPAGMLSRILWMPAMAVGLMWLLMVALVRR